MKKSFNICIVAAIIMTLCGCQIAKVEPDTQRVDKPISSQKEATQPAVGKSPQIKSTVAKLSPEAAGKIYYEATKQRDFAKVVSMISDYSLSFLNLNREGAKSAFTKKDSEGWRMLDYKITETKLLDDQKALIHVLTKETIKNQEPKTNNFWIAMRKENGQWRMNSGGIVDDETLTMQPKGYKGIIVQPLRIIRYLDKMRVVVKVENIGSRICYWGWGTDKLLVLNFGQKAVDTSGSLKVEPKRTYPGVNIDVKGFHEAFPKSMELIKWQWASQASPNQPEAKGETWKYSFELQN